MSERENILLIRLKSIGDVVLTLPAVNAIRDNFPDARITFLTSKETAPLLGGFREVNHVIAVDRAGLRSGHPSKMAGQFIRLLRQLRAEKFSLVVDFQGYGETAWVAWLTGAPQRWGSVYGPGREWLYTRGIRRNEQIHFADWNLALLQQCGLRVDKVRNEFVLPEGVLAETRNFCAANQLIPGRPILFLQPFTSTPHKTWPLDNYLAVARHWRSHDVQVVMGGGPAERAVLERAQAEGFVVSAGVPLLVTAGLMQLATLVLGGDTGTLHLAVAQGRRVLMLMHEVVPGSPIPFRHPDWVMVAPMPQAIQQISVAAVLAATERVFNESAGNVSC